MRLVTKADAGQWIKATTEYERIMAKAATLAMRSVGKEAEKLGRSAIASAGFGSRWQRSLKALDKPPSGYVLNPAVWLHSTINFSDVFETGRTITGSPFLWLPLPSVPPWPGDPTRQMSPKKYVQTIGPLVTMRRPGKLPLLGAVVRKGTRPQPFGRFATRARLRKGRSISTRTATETIPMFVAVSIVAIPKKFDILATSQRALEGLESAYEQNLETYRDPNGD